MTRDELAAAADKEQADRFVDAVEDVQRRGLQEFLDWLASPPKRSPVFLATHAPGMKMAPTGELTHALGEEIIGAYYDIDLAAVERHRMRILGRLP